MFDPLNLGNHRATQQPLRAENKDRHQQREGKTSL
jgi:hypothetical protein